MSLSELARLLGDFAEIAIMVLLAYVVYKIAILVDSLNRKIRADKSTPM